MLDHLAQLEIHNEREWFRAHARERKAARQDFEGLVLGVMLGLADRQPGILDYRPADLCYGLVRDTRRPHEGGPYHTAFRAVIGPWGRVSIPTSAFLFVQPGDRSFIGGGLFARCFREATVRVRDRIAREEQAWETVVSAPELAEFFGQIQREKLKRVPAGYDPMARHGEYLKHKNWFVLSPLPDRLFTREEALTERILAACAAMAPLCTFLNQAIGDYRPPQW